MMDWTDRHFRFLMRLLTQNTLLYTEMVTTPAILRGDRRKLLQYNPIELPLVLQLGGDKPEEMAECAKIAQEEGFTEVNINVGCPSDRVQSGNFGACLMARPEQVAECIDAMKAVVHIPISIKCRIGIDGKESYKDLWQFVAINQQAGCEKFIIHARIAILKGLSPAENRKIPPLRYADVYRLKQDFPKLWIELNGGIRDWQAGQEHMGRVDAIMIGRAAYENPMLFAQADRLFWQRPVQPQPMDRREILRALMPYIDRHIANGGKIHHILRHTMGIFYANRGAKAYKRFLSQTMYRDGAGSSILEDFIQQNLQLWEHE